jgi:hypothetical protein
MPFRAQFDRVAANLDYGVACHGISFVCEGEWSTLDFDKGKAPIRFG